jgi:hypothetical protein
MNASHFAIDTDLQMARTEFCAAHLSGVPRRQATNISGERVIGEQLTKPRDV